MIDVKLKILVGQHLQLGGGLSLLLVGEAPLGLAVRLELEPLMCGWFDSL